MSQTLQHKAANRVSQVLRSQGLDKGDAIDSDDDEEGLTLDDVSSSGGGGSGLSAPASALSIFPFSNRSAQSGGVSVSADDGGNEMDDNSNSNSGGGASGGGGRHFNPGPDADGWETAQGKKSGGRRR